MESSREEKYQSTIKLVLWKVDVSQLAWLELQAGFTHNRRRQEPFV
jgi:hypothetical protein